MKALVFHGVGDIRLDTVNDPHIQDPLDAIVRITTAAICGTDLHMIRGTLPGMKKGTVLGHEGVGIVERLGAKVRNFRVGDRVVIASTVGCGYCSYCRAGYYSQCDNANPGGARTGTVFFGGPLAAGALDGMQAEYVRVPFANITMVRLPDDVDDEQAIMLSDIFPTGYFGADLAEVKQSDTVAVYGAGPVGLMAVVSAYIHGATRVFCVDREVTRLGLARHLGAEVINFDEDDPVEVIKDLTGGIGVDRVIDAVGVDAEAPHSGPAAKKARAQQDRFQEETEEVAPKTNPQGENWHPGGAPSQALHWALGSLAKAGTLGIIGVYPQTMQSFPIGMAMNRNLTIKAGNCPHRRYIPKLLEMIRRGTVHPGNIITNAESMVDAVDAMKHFDQRLPGWTKVRLTPQQQTSRVR